MLKATHWILVAAALTASAVLAKLPPPTPEEQAAVSAKKAAQEKQLKQEAEALAKAQDRVAQRYRKEHAATQARTPRSEMPKTTGDLPRGVGPTPDRPASGEAHSAPAK